MPIVKNLIQLNLFSSFILIINKEQQNQTQQHFFEAFPIAEQKLSLFSFERFPKIASEINFQEKASDLFYKYQMAIKRLRKQIHALQKNPPVNCISAGPINEENLYNWEAKFQGPQGTPYQNGLFILSIQIPEMYPFSTPKCKLKTKIYHPNINEEGRISTGHCVCCESCAKNTWSPALTIKHMIEEVIAIITEPNPDEPLMVEIAKEMKKDKKSFQKTAKEWTQKYASQ